MRPFHIIHTHILMWVYVWEREKDSCSQDFCDSYLLYLRHLPNSMCCIKDKTYPIKTKQIITKLITNLIITKVIGLLYEFASNSPSPPKQTNISHWRLKWFSFRCITYILCRCCKPKKALFGIAMRRVSLNSLSRNKRDLETISYIVIQGEG